MRLRIEKQKRRLTLRQGRTLLFSCRVQLGSHPVGPKRREGDGRTPEGSYRVCSRNPKSRFHRALGISYPGAADARAALAAGLIGEAQRRAIESAQRRGERPPWDTPLGGWIMIHGQPGDGRSAAGDWTAGCVAVSDADAEWLFDRAFVGLRVTISP